jgi:hypothetical protein
MKPLLRATRAGLLACIFGLLWYFGWSSAASLLVRLGQQSCSYALAPISQSFDAQGGNGTVNVTATTTGSNCPWTVSNPLNWVSLINAANRTGSGALLFTVAANPALTSRRGELTVAGRVFTIEQAGLGGNCLTLPVRNHQPVTGTLAGGDCRATTQGADGAFADKYEFTAQAGELIIITMDAASFTPRLYLFGPSKTLLTESSFVGNNSARLPSAPDFYSVPRTGVYTIEASTHTQNVTGDYRLALTIVPAGCDFYSIFPNFASFESQGGTSGLQVAAGSNCPWRATSNANWLTVTAPGLASGSLPVRYSVAANAGDYRMATISAGNQNFMVEQAGAGGQCGPRPLTNGQTVNSTLSDADCRSRLRDTNIPNSWVAERFSFTARAGEQLVLNFASGFAPYLYLLTSGKQVLAESDSPRPLENSAFTIPADGEYLIEITPRYSVERGDYALTLNLFAPGCGYGITPGNQVVEASGGNGTIAVTAGNGCPWTARANAAWLTVTSGSSGTGNSTVRFTAAPNVEALYRSATLTIAGQTFTVEQPGMGSSCAPLPLNAGQRINSTLNAADCRSRLRPANVNPYYAERYSLTGTAGQQVRFTVSNSSFTPYLLLLSGTGQVLTESTRTLPVTSGYYTLPADGPYVLEVTTESPPTGGAYTLLFETQSAGCNYLVTPSFLGVEANGGMHSFNVSAPDGCAWMTTSNASWLTITEGSSGSGNGTIKFNVAANNTTILRRATLLAAGRSLAVDQAGAGGSCMPRPLSAGQTVTGTLSNADCRSRLTLTSGNEGMAVNQYTLNLQAGEQLFVSAVTENLTPTLVLYNASGRELARSGANPLGRLPASGFFSVPATGIYLLEVVLNDHDIVRTFSVTTSCAL